MFNEMNQLMVDIEAFSTGNKALPVSIGAVFFNIETGETGDTFYCNINARDASKYGLEIDADTVYWWLEQNKAAQIALLSDQLPLNTAFEYLKSFVRERAGKGVEMWSHSTFDAVVLANAARACEQRLPWRFQKTRDIRTLNSMVPKEFLKPIREGLLREGDHHNALDDAIYQTRYVSAQWNAVMNGEIPDQVKKNIQFNG